MVLSSTTPSALARHQQRIDRTLRASIQKVIATSGTSALDTYYGQMQYHLGWVDAGLHPTRSNPGKLIRPTLLLLAYEAVGAWGYNSTDLQDEAYLQRALPAAAAIELTHNFTLIHDDIEDGDTERRHRPTLWNLWGVSQGINSGDGMFALSRLVLWDVLEHGVEGAIAARLAATMDRAVMVIAEGQYLDISFETREDISVNMYEDMIRRKTAVLLGCAAEMGAMLGTHDQQTITSFRNFGLALGIAFQVRDDLLGVWASTAESGKTPAGDIYRRKKSLPILHALEHASDTDRKRLYSIYRQEQAISQEQVEDVLEIFARTQSQSYCRTFLQNHYLQAHQALAAVPTISTTIAARARNDIQTLLHALEDATH